MRRSTIENKYGDDNLLEVVFYMTKPRSVGTFKTVAQTMPRPQQTYQPQPQAQQSIEESRKKLGDNLEMMMSGMTSSNIDALTFDRQKNKFNFR